MIIRNLISSAAIATMALAPSAVFAGTDVDAFIGDGVGYSCSIDETSAERELTQTNSTTADLPSNNAGGNLFQISQNADTTWTFSGLTNVGDLDATSGFIDLEIKGGVNETLESELGGGGDEVDVDGRITNAPVFMSDAQIVDDGGLRADGEYRIRGVLECVSGSGGGGGGGGVCTGDDCDDDD